MGRVPEEIAPSIASKMLIKKINQTTPFTDQVFRNKFLL